MTGLTENILAIDTALNGISICVLCGNQPFVCQHETQREQASLLVPLIMQTLQKAGMGYKDLHKIAVTVGPGSFTGLRIGLSTARSYGLALDIPVVGVETLQLAAASAPANMPVLSVLETKRQDFYIQSFDTQGQALCPPVALEAAEIEAQFTQKRWHLVTDAAARFQRDVSDSWLSAHVAGITEIRLLDPHRLAYLGRELDPAQALPNPLYLRGADVSTPKTPPRRLRDVSL